MKNDEITKTRVTLPFDKLDATVKDQVIRAYPDGFSEFLIPYHDKYGNVVMGLRYETDEKIYLIRMSVADAERILQLDVDDDNDDPSDDNDPTMVESEYLNSLD